MPDQPEPTPATDAVRALAHFLHEPDTDALSQKEIRSQLSAAGVNMENVKKRLSTVLAQAEGRSVLAGARTQRRTFMTRMVALRERLSESGDLRERVRDLVQDAFGDRAEAAVAWRNFEQATDEDLATMLEDLTLLEELEKDDNAPPSA